MTEDLKNFMEEVKRNPETAEKFNKMIRDCRENGRELSEAAAELGYDISTAQLERFIAEREKLDPDALSRIVGRNGGNVNCIGSYSCITALMYSDEPRQCLQDYYCVKFNNPYSPDGNNK